MLLEEPETGSYDLAHVAEATRADLRAAEAIEVVSEGDAGVLGHAGPLSLNYIRVCSVNSVSTLLVKKTLEYGIVIENKKNDLMKEQPVVSAADTKRYRENLIAAAELSDLGIALMRQNIARALPNSSREIIDRELLRWLVEQPSHFVPNGD